MGTAGSVQKRKHLRDLGIVSLSSSRDTGFAEAFAARSPAAAPNVVLNSLTSPGQLSCSILTRNPDLVLT